MDMPCKCHYRDVAKGLALGGKGCKAFVYDFLHDYLNCACCVGWEGVTPPPVSKSLCDYREYMQFLILTSFLRSVKCFYTSCKYFNLISVHGWEYVYFPCEYGAFITKWIIISVNHATIYKERHEVEELLILVSYPKFD